MKHLTALLFCACVQRAAYCQTTLYFEAFDNGVMTFDINTTDVGSAGLTGYNKFIINNSYAGGSGNTSCLGFPFSFNVPTTAGQPAGISGSPNSNYLHTLSNVAENSGIFSCCFLAADGVCSNGENYFSEMNTDISTAGHTGVAFSFWWLCSGGTNNYGEVYFSIDGGNNWNLLSSPITQYNNQNNWTQATIINSLFDNQSTLRFGFRFVNQQTLSAADPGFGIDDIRITGSIARTPTLATDTVTGNPFCPGENITVEYSVTGTFNSGNVFTAELSDSSGNFSNGVAIGSTASIVSGIINATIPLSTPLGSGYRIWVISSNPALVANDNGVDLVVALVASVSLGTLSDVCEFDAPFPMYGGSPAGGDYLGTGIANNIFDPMAAGTGTFNIIYTFSDLTGCSDSATNKITVNPVPDASFSGLSSQYCSTDASVNLVGSPSGGTFLGSGITGNVFDPANAGSGNVEVHYLFINQQNCADTASQSTVVNVCNGISELNENDFSVYQNPADAAIIVCYVSKQEQIITVRILNLLGQQVLEKPIGISMGEQMMRFSFNNEAGGVHLISVQTSRGETTRKLLLFSGR